jgi:predicted deacylase
LACLVDGGWIDPSAEATALAMSGTSATDRGLVTSLAAVEVIQAPVAGILSYEVVPGDQVRPGDLVGWLTDPQTGIRTPLIAHYGGLCYARVLNRLACAGDEVIFLAGQQAHRTGDLLGL